MSTSAIAHTARSMTRSLGTCGTGPRGPAGPSAHGTHVEVGILDQSEAITKRVAHRGDADAAADRGDRLERGGPEREQPLELDADLRDAPERLRTCGCGREI